MKGTTGDETYDSHSDAIDRNDILDRCVTLGLVQTISARLVECAKVLGIEAGDVVLST